MRAGFTLRTLWSLRTRHAGGAGQIGDVRVSLGSLDVELRIVRVVHVAGVDHDELAVEHSVGGVAGVHFGHGLVGFRDGERVTLRALRTLRSLRALRAGGTLRTLRSLRAGEVEFLHICHDDAPYCWLVMALTDWVLRDAGFTGPAPGRNHRSPG